MSLRILMVTSEWPTPEHPEWATFVVQQVRGLRESGLQVDVFSFRGNKNPWNYLTTWIKLRRHYQLSSYDVLHAQYGQSGLIALPSSIPLVVTFHGSDLQGIVGSHGRYTLSGKLLQHLSRWVSQKATKVIVVSERLQSFLPPNVPAEVIPGGVDINLFIPIEQREARMALGLPLGKRLILFPARPDDPVKRYGLAKTVFERVIERFDVEMVFLQAVPHEKVPLYLNACDVLLLTSWHEGSPTVVKEALACNLPVVAVDVGDVRERIGNVEGCVVCDDDSPEKMATAMKQILCAGKRIKGREAVLDLNERILVQRIVAVYEKAIIAHQ